MSLTQDILKTNIYRLEQCSAKMSSQLSNLLSYGERSCKTKINNLLILNDSIKLLLKYNLTPNTNNCLTLAEFTTIYNNATVLCKLCDCQ